MCPHVHTTRAGTASSPLVICRTFDIAGGWTENCYSLLIGNIYPVVSDHRAIRTLESGEIWHDGDS